MSLGVYIDCDGCADVLTAGPDRKRIIALYVPPDTPTHPQN